MGLMLPSMLHSCIFTLYLFHLEIGDSCMVQSVTELNMNMLMLWVTGKNLPVQWQVFILQMKVSIQSFEH